MFMNFNAPEDALAAFTQMQVTDKAYLSSLAWQKSWQHLQKRLQEGGLKDMQFEGFLGPEHLLKMMGWIDKIPYPDYFDASSHSELINHARNVDKPVFKSVGLSPGDTMFRIFFFNAPTRSCLRNVPAHFLILGLATVGKAHSPLRRAARLTVSLRWTQRLPVI